jgi:hypothetical protein
MNPPPDTPPHSIPPPGLSVPEPLAALLAGTPAAKRFAEARAHLRTQFDALAPVFKTLLAAYGQHLRAEWFTWAAFVWAAELWYAYAIQVRVLRTLRLLQCLPELHKARLRWAQPFVRHPNPNRPCPPGPQVRLPDGTVTPALAPYASLLNHSPWPHVVRFSKVQAATGTLQLQLLRPAAAGEEVCLSYGPLPNEELLLFYGFTVPGNPAEKAEVELAADFCSEGAGGGSSGSGDGKGGGGGASAKLQAARKTVLGKLGLSPSVSLRPGWRGRQLPRLLPPARVLAADEGRLAAWAASRGRCSRSGGGGAAWPDAAAVDGSNEAAAVALLEASVAAARAPYEAAIARVRAAVQAQKGQQQAQQPASCDGGGAESGSSGDGSGDFSLQDTAAFLGHLETWLSGVIELLA